MQTGEILAIVAITICFIITLLTVNSCLAENFHRYDIHRCYAQQKEKPVEEVLKLCGTLAVSKKR